jgi:WD40 repeat protein
MTFSHLRTLKYHDSLVTELVEIEEPMLLASVSIDGLVRLYEYELDKWYSFDVTAEQTQSVVDERRKKGVLGLSYSREFGNYLLSFGYSNLVYMHSLDISLTKGYTGKYSEHTGTIMWAKFLKSSPYVVSFDDKLNLRIWDFRTLNTAQFINCEKIFINPSRLEVMP